MEKKGNLLAVYAVVLVLLHLLGGWLPWRIARHVRYSRTLDNALALASGVMLAAGLTRLLPAAQAQSYPALDQAQASFPSYPLAECLCIAGFLFCLGAEHGVSCEPDVQMQRRCVYFACPLSVKRSVPFLSGLSVHSLLAGIGLGIQQHAASVHAVFGAIASHAVFEAMALGNKLVFDGATLTEFASVITPFAFVTSAGIPLGYAVGSRNTWALLVLHAIVAGTFLYIGCKEALGRMVAPEREHFAGVHAHTSGLGEHADAPKCHERDVCCADADETHDVDAELGKNGSIEDKHAGSCCTPTEQAGDEHSDTTDISFCTSLPNRIASPFVLSNRFIRLIFTCTGVGIICLAEIAHQHSKNVRMDHTHPH